MTLAGFVDEASLHVRAGDGGAGCISFRREAHVSRGGPDGGNGGKGGDVWLEATTNMSSLLVFKDHPFQRAGNGTHGQGKLRHGRNGKDRIVLVPEGTIVKSPDGERLADLVSAPSRWLAARGGRGGRGNASFLTNQRRAPSFAEQGEIGEERWLKLELKLMADVAVVGLPNSGKSTFVSSVSAAKPRIAPYPFTTLQPHLGVVRLGPASDPAGEFVIADTPGLIEGASQGRGLGHRFLRHIERARLLLFLLDLASVEGYTPQEQESILLKELERYDKSLLTRPRLVVGSKKDIVPDYLVGSNGYPPYAISAVQGSGVDEVLWKAWQMLQEMRSTDTSPSDRSTLVVHRPEPREGIQVTREGEGVFVVRSKAAERAVALSDLTDPQAVSYVQDRLRRLGVENALVSAGIAEGDVVRIGTLEFVYFSDGGVSKRARSR